jgi:hypothetical protein
VLLSQPHNILLHSVQRGAQANGQAVLVQQVARHLRAGRCAVSIGQCGQYASAAASGDEAGKAEAHKNPFLLVVVATKVEQEEVFHAL